MRIHHPSTHPLETETRMKTRPITIHVPDKVLLAEKTDEESFSRALATLAAVTIIEL